MTLVDIRDLSVRLESASRTVAALSGVSLSIDRGEIVGVVGESGAGKTMLARAITGLLPEHAATSGELLFDGVDVLAMTGEQLRRHRGAGAAMCFQSPRRTLAPFRTVGGQIDDRLATHRWHAPEDASALALLEAVGIRDAQRRLRAYPHELSGGMAQRVMISLALSCYPSLLVADEPTTGLDVTLTRGILDLIASATDGDERTVLVISHDIAAISRICDRIVVMYGGIIVEEGPTASVIRSPAHPYTAALLDSVPDIASGPRRALLGLMPQFERAPEACPFAPRCTLAEDRCLAGLPAPRRIGDDWTAACVHAGDDRVGESGVALGNNAAAVPAPGVPIMAVDGVEVVHGGRFGRGGHRALRGVSIEVAAGETVGVVGESGSGKTTLARAILGLVRPTAGFVAFEGRDLRTLSGRELRALRRRMQMVFQDPLETLDPRRTVRQTLSDSLRLAEVTGTAAEARIAETLQRVALDQSMLGSRRHELSGGQAQRVGIARALIVDPDLIVFDEPTSALDVTVQAQILELIESLMAERSRAYLYVSHDLATVRNVASRVVVLYLGTVVEEGPSEEVFRRPLHPYTRALFAGIPSSARRRERSAGRRRAATRPRRACRRRRLCPRAPLPLRRRPLHDRAAVPYRTRCGRPSRRLLESPGDHMTDTRPFRIAVDIGGTFVDAVELDTRTRSIRLRKASTTPREPWRGVLEALALLGTPLDQVELFIHGTTLGLNAVLERRGARTGIIANEGLRDVFLIGRANVPDHSMYDFQYEQPTAIVRRRDTVGVGGRLDYRGREIDPLDEEGVRRAAAYLVTEQGVDAIAVCFLHSYRNDEHERRAGEIVRALYPDVEVSVSSELVQEYREYERTSTSVLDAYIRPIFARYVGRLEDTLREQGFAGRFLIMRSGGGAMTAAQARRSPTHTILSGPAGGIVGSARLARALERPEILTFDAGGTSLDLCVIEGGDPVAAHEAELERYPLLIPVYDIRTLGAGGGSIAAVEDGLLKVGPRSAGADPDRSPTAAVASTRRSPTRPSRSATSIPARSLPVRCRSTGTVRGAGSRPQSRVRSAPISRRRPSGSSTSSPPAPSGPSARRRRSAAATRARSRCSPLEVRGRCSARSSRASSAFAR